MPIQRPRIVISLIKRFVIPCNADCALCIRVFLLQPEGLFHPAMSERVRTRTQISVLPLCLEDPKRSMLYIERKDLSDV